MHIVIANVDFGTEHAVVADDEPFADTFDFDAGSD